jgi:glycosyltransferase involved in cell wall biosynthesis
VRPFEGVTVVSVTPVAADRDSRARKIAASFGRHGMRSILVEGARSRGSAVTAFEVVSIGRRRTDVSGSRLPARRARSLFRLVVDRMLIPAVRLPPAALYYLHSPHHYPGIALRRLFRRTPFIYDAHDFYRALPDFRQLPRWRQRVENLIEARCIRRASAVVTVSDGVVELFESTLGVRPAVLRNTHDVRLDTPSPTSIREALGVGPDEFLAVQLGQRKPDTPIREVIAAMQLAKPEVHFAFMGQGFEAARELASADPDVRKRVHFVTPVDPAEVVPFIRSADAAAVLYEPTNPSVAACLPNGFFQSISAGLPVIYSDVLPMVAAHAESAGMVVRLGDPHSIAAALDRLASDAEFREKCRTRSADRAAQLEWADEEPVLLELVEHALAGG